MSGCTWFLQLEGSNLPSSWITYVFNHLSSLETFIVLVCITINIIDLSELFLDNVIFLNLLLRFKWLLVPFYGLEFSKGRIPVLLVIGYKKWHLAHFL